MKPAQTNISRILIGFILVFCDVGAAEQQPGQTEVNSVGMKLAYIPPGTFTMGSPNSEKGRTTNEVQTQETIETGFLIGVTEVTQEQWRRVMETNPSFFKGDDLPVENITWHEAMVFCKRLSDMEKKHYRLPTSPEWEYACRAGSTTTYGTGDDSEALKKAGWFNRNSKNKSHPAGLKQPNKWGIYDMHGNVSEWCSIRDDTYQSESKLVNDEIKEGRDLRGGSWGLTAADCRSAARHRNNGNYRYFDLGFRVVCEISTEVTH